MKNFAINLENIQDIPFETYEKNFTFIVNGKKYVTNRIIADILSPTIRKLHFSDESVIEFHINTKPIDTKFDYFQEFLQLSMYSTINLDENHKNYFSEYFLHLGNIEEYFRLNNQYYKNITSDNAIDYLIDLHRFQTKIIQQIGSNSINSTNVFSNATNQKLIDFISQNFENVKKTRMKELDFDTIEKVISNESLQLFEEDTLLLFIIELYEYDTKYSPLFEYVIFPNVKEETLHKFINLFSIEYMNNSIWNSIARRLFQLNDKKSIEKAFRYKSDKSSILNKVIQFHPNVSNFEYKKDNKFNGILRHLVNETKGNIHDNGTIEITSNSIALNIYHPKNLVDYEKDNFYFSKDISNSFVCFDFKNKSVRLSSYSIRSHSDAQNYSHLRNWVLEESEDAKIWKVIDAQKNCASLNGSNLAVNFQIGRKDDDNKFYRYVRIRSVGNSWYQYGSHNQIYFSLIEFYGEIKTN